MSSSLGICNFISVSNNFPAIVISISALTLIFNVSLSLKKYSWKHCRYCLGLLRLFHCVITFESTRDYIHNRLPAYRNIYYSHAILLKLNQNRKRQTPYNWITDESTIKTYVKTMNNYVDGNHKSFFHPTFECTAVWSHILWQKRSDAIYSHRLIRLAFLKKKKEKRTYCQQLLLLLKNGVFSKGWSGRGMNSNKYGEW